jgi:uncharacterized protein
MIEPVLEQKLARLKALLMELKAVVVTFSGGVDSALLLKVAVDTLGEKALALTADSPTFPPEERELAIRVAKAIGAQHLLVEAHELEQEGYAQNNGNRCYFCKSELFMLARREADRLRIRWVLDGTILDDLGDDRPGLKAASEQEVRHLLVEAGFYKADVRAAAKAFNLEIWDKPSFACLGSRFAVGTRVTLDRIDRVRRVESFLRSQGFRQLRVRYHELKPGEELLRLEVSVSELFRVVSPEIREALLELAKKEGFKKITLDLEGYRTSGLGA